MKIKLFISWSGERSKKVAEIFKENLSMMIQDIEPYISSEDIEKGTRWSSNIAGQLEETNFGIICVTKENMNSQWLNFEAGALSKSIDKAKVCPFLFDLQPSDLFGSPLTQFQLTTNSKEDVYKMFTSLNNSLEDDKLDNERLSKIFDKYWTSIEEEFSSITTSVESLGIKKDKNAEVLEEILKLLNNQSNLLNNPENILPADYFRYIMKKCSFNNGSREQFRISKMTLSEMTELLDFIDDNFIKFDRDAKSVIKGLLVSISHLLKDNLKCADINDSGVNRQMILRSEELIERVRKTIKAIDKNNELIELDSINNE